MKDNKWYLKEDAYFEPLINRWYAWTHLIAPATCARHIVGTQKRIMTSFVNNFHLHQLASKEKDLTGSEFLSLDETELPKVRELLKDLNSNCADLIELADGIKELDEILRCHSSGESIEPLYAKVPEPLKGYVELFMDIEHHPGYRFIEPLMYLSRFYNPGLQALSLGLLSKVQERPFVFSTPRLPDDNHIQIPISFNNCAVDKLFGAREKPLSASEVAALFEQVGIEGGLSPSELFTQAPPEKRHEPVSSGVRLTYTGHAGFLIETADVSIMIDPVIACRDSNEANDMVSFSELPAKIDYTCLTHCHHDHVNIETLLQLRYKLGKILVPKNNGGTLIDPSVRLLLKQLNMDAIELEDLEIIDIPGGRIIAIPFLGEHGDLNIRSKTAWYIELLGKKFFFGADSSNPEKRMYQLLGKIVCDIDVLAIGMECVGAPYTWLYGALNTKVISKVIKNSRRLNGSDSAQAMDMVKEFKAKQVIVYALGREQCFKYFMGLEYDDDSKQLVESNNFVKLCQQQDLPAASMYGRNTMHFAPS